jgi:hypothetical protein
MQASPMSHERNQKARTKKQPKKITKNDDTKNISSTRTATSIIISPPTGAALRIVEKPPPCRFLERERERERESVCVRERVSA